MDQLPVGVFVSEPGRACIYLNPRCAEVVGCRWRSASGTAGRGLARFYTRSLTDAVNLRLDLDTRLRGALEREEFLLQYQAKYDPNGRITGAESLVRLQPSDRPMVPPNQFIPVAEGFVARVRAQG